ncbi:MAG: transglutaminase-like cysteine peptidase [Pseudomonadota bacterium]
MPLVFADVTLPMQARPSQPPWVGVSGWLLRLALLLSLLLGSSGGAWESQKLMASAQKMGPPAMAQAQALTQEIAEAAAQDETARLKTINVFFNRHLDYQEDREVWGVVDYWASPLESLSKGAGDCEDYAIGKYFSLMAAGVSGAKMRLVYVRAEVGGVVLAHMVLAYYPEPNAEPLILDNLITDIRPASRRPDLAPVFSFNAEGLWQGVGSATAGDPVARLSRWREVLTKTRAEGWWK